MQTLTDGEFTWQWSDSCANCGCVANWHAFELPEGATMVALPERFPCRGFEFGGCPHNCGNYVFERAVVHHTRWETVKEAARAALSSGS